MNDQEQPTGDMKQYYVLGAVVLIAVVVAGYMLRPKSSMSPTSQSPTAQQAAVPTPGPITKLDCDTQYYNTKIGFPEYYLSVEGGDISKATKVDCTFTASASGKIVATSTVISPLTDRPERGGSTFRCTTKAIALTPSTPTVVEIALKDDLGATATCSGPFVFPAP